MCCSRSFHDVEPQPGLGDELFQPLRLSRRVVSGGQGYVVPGRLLAENTLVLSEDAVVGCRNGRHYLMFRWVRDGTTPCSGGLRAARPHIQAGYGQHDLMFK